MSMKWLRRAWIPSSQHQLLQSQRALLAFHGCFPGYEEHRTRLPSSGQVINNVESRTGPRNGRTAVLAHGLGSGLAMYFSNLNFFRENFERVIAFDWLGFGGSSRPGWTASHLKEGRAREEASAAFFVDSFREFCEVKELQEFDLFAHSLGGFLGGEFALSDAVRLKTLTLVSPAGLAALPPEEDIMTRAQMAPPLRIMDAAWSCDVTPGQLVRLMGPSGPQRVERALRRRFRDRWSDNETKLISSYLYHITAARGSGEFAMNGVLRPVARKSGGVGVYARRPLSPRWSAHGIRGVPIKIIYGDTDWLYQRPDCDEAVAQLVNVGLDVQLAVAPRAGHHIYLDNPQWFHEYVSSQVLGEH